MSTQPGAGLVSNTTGTSAAGDPKPALDVVRRWNDGVNRHTLYTACGTLQDGWGIFNDPGNQAGRDGLLGLVNAIQNETNNLVRGVGGGQTITQLPPDGVSAAALGAASPDTIVGVRINPDLFNWVPVSYPASFPAGASPLDNAWQPQNISINDSITIGANQMIALINATPGTFALCGMSQGSVVISQVLRALLPGGRLQHRYNDCIGAVAFGNPCRKQGTAYPGAPANNTAGMFSLQAGKVRGLGSLQTLPPWWWEMSTPGDFFSDVPFSAASGMTGTVMNQIVTTFANFKGLGFDIVSQIANIAKILASTAAPLIAAGRTASGTAAVRALGLWLRDLGMLGLLRTVPYDGANPIQSFFSAGFVGLARGVVKGLLKLTDAELADNLLLGNSMYQYGNPHMFYGAWKAPALPPGLAGVNSNSSYVDLAVAYLNQQGATIAPRGSSTRTL